MLVFCIANDWRVAESEIDRCPGARAGAHARAFAWDRARVARARDVRRMAIDPAMRPCVAPAGAAEDGDEDDEGGEGGTEDARGRATGEDDANDANR